MAENIDAVDEAIIKFDDDESLAKNKKDPVEDDDPRRYWHQCLPVDRAESPQQLA